jgi:hypothetical protein
VPSFTLPGLAIGGKVETLDLDDQHPPDLHRHRPASSPTVV